MFREEYVAVIQAGGMGTRMKRYTNDLIPKPMLKINGKPMLQWQIENIKRFGISEFVIIIGHLGEKIKEYFGDGSILGVSIKYIEENEPLGSAGALFYLKDEVKEACLFVFGDVMFDIALDKMLAFHEKHNKSITLLVHPNGHPYDSDLVVVNDDERVVKLLGKNDQRKFWYDNLVNAGIYIIDHYVLKDISSLQKLDLEKDIISKYIEKNEVMAYKTPEYVKDAGTLDRFELVAKEQRKGVWQKKNLNNRQKCIFFDRDGTLTKYNGLISKDEQLELEDKTTEAIRRVNQSEYLAIVVTNQPVVARGMCSMGDVKRIHRKLQTLLGMEGAYLDDIAFCPHHPDKGYSEENPIYKMVCSCRKPATGMIDCMVEKYNIDISQSWLIGDTTVDIKTAKNAGLKSILVKTGKAGSDYKFEVQSDFVANDILDAINIILGEESDD